MQLHYKLDILPNKPPTERLLFKYGSNKTTKGTFYFTKDSAKRIMDMWAEYGNKAVFDYNHMQLADVQTPESAVSAGTFDLALKDDGLWAVNINWTELAAEKIRNKEYLYTSPAFDIENQGGKKVIIELINCALTNLPATYNMDQLMAASKYHKKELIMTDIKEDEQVEAAVVAEAPIDAPAQEEEAETDPQAIIDELNMKIKELEAKIAELTGETEESKVSLSKKDKEIETLTTKIDTNEKEALVNKAITANKLFPAQRELYLKLNKTELEAELNKLQTVTTLNKTMEVTVTEEETEVQKLTSYINKRVFGK